MIDLNDAGLLREHLAQELAEWIESGFFSSTRAARWRRLTERLARMTGISRDEIVRDLREDAEALECES